MKWLVVNYPEFLSTLKLNWTLCAPVAENPTLSTQTESIVLIVALWLFILYAVFRSPIWLPSWILQRGPGKKCRYGYLFCVHLWFFSSSLFLGLPIMLYHHCYYCSEVAWVKNVLYEINLRTNQTYLRSGFNAVLNQFSTSHLCHGKEKVTSM
jgi:hypothetical protein